MSILKIKQADLEPLTWQECILLLLNKMNEVIDAVNKLKGE